MENIKENCSLKEHENSDAIKYCPECKIYMCIKCDKLHSELFKIHHEYNYLDKDKEQIYTGFCQEKNHSYKLEFFCKNHNQLCCLACLNKMKNNIYGQHSNCSVITIEEIKDEKKSKYNENIRKLEELSKTFQNCIEKLKIMIENIEKDKEELKSDIQIIFTKFRNILNDREDELLLDVDNQFDELFPYEDLKKKSEKLPNLIKKSLEKGKLLENKWNNNDKLDSLINDCIYIENNVQGFNKVENELNKFNLINYKIKFNPLKEEINKLFETIKSFGKININVNNINIEEKREKMLNEIEQKVFDNEKECYCKMINKILVNEPELKDKLPINYRTNEIFEKIKDCSILAKLINICSPGTIDEKAIIKEQQMSLRNNERNFNLIINSAKSIGCLVEITANDILNNIKCKIINLLYEILKKIVLKKISMEYYPQLLRLKEDKEEYEDLLKIGPEDFLIRWFNFYLSKANHRNKITNFSDDLKDSEKYIILFHQISPNVCDISPFNITDLNERARKVLSYGKNVGVEIYIKEEDIKNGNERLNLFFISEIFLTNNGMGEATQEEKMIAAKILDDDDEGAREERSFRTWINSLKLENTKKVNNLYEECRSEILLLKIIDKIKPGIVEWKKVELKTKNPFKIGVNCQEVINACKRSGYSIISIGNKDIQEGKKKHILAIVWQLMKAHTLKSIGEKSEEDLISWSNSKVSAELKIKSLKEKKLNNGLFWINLLGAIYPGCINWNYVTKENLDDKRRELNAKYVLSIARSLGACTFVVWEDICEVKSKMLLILLASLYDISQFHKSNN